MSRHPGSDPKRSASWFGFARAGAAGLAAMVAAGGIAAADTAETAQWIWYPDRDPAQVDQVARYFRRTFPLAHPEAGRLEITCDDEYELFVNGERVGGDATLETMEVFDVTAKLVDGENVVAVRAVNKQAGTPAGLVVRLIVREVGGTDVSLSSDDRWVCQSYGPRGWQVAAYDDSKWAKAKSLGAFGAALPWRGKVKSNSPRESGRFTVPEGFRVERVVPPTEAGSIIAIAFDELGDLIVSRESGPLMRFTADPEKGLEPKGTVFADQITQVQGILPLNGAVYAVGKGPKGPSLCRLTDADRDGQAEKIETLLEFTGEMAEHGPHAVALGPDGMLYIACGNLSQPKAKIASSSPYRVWYEGDILKPRYEDPNGHAAGVKAPGGSVVRTDVDGKTVEFFAGGFRNHYDIAFNRWGDLFTLDSDMEWDVGLAWYRPARVLHVAPGGEYGWRSGWANWPVYYPDQHAPVADYGRGSPTGVEFYEHDAFPARYKGALLAADWTLGRICAIFPIVKEGEYHAAVETLVQGRPLNVTDLAVGPDGAVYFATGGRNTEGGVFRLVAETAQEPPPREGALAAIQQPQFQSAWARNELAAWKQENGDKWNQGLAMHLDDPKKPAEERVQILQTLNLMGPFPSKKFLVRLSTDPSEEIRCAAAYHMGVHSDATTTPVLVQLLDDKSPRVQTAALNSLLRANVGPPLPVLAKLLGSSSPSLRYAAMLAVRSMPVKDVQAMVLTTSEASVFADGAVGLLGLDPKTQPVDAEKIVQRGRQLLRGYLSDDDFVAVLRAFELALHRHELSDGVKAAMAKDLSDEFPAADARMNREVAKILCSLQYSAALPRMLDHLDDKKVAQEEKVHLAVCLRYLETGWDNAKRLRLLKFYESARIQPGAPSLGRYVDNAARDFLTQFSARDRGELLANGERMPGMALQILRSVPTTLSAEQVAALVDLDARLERRTDVGAVQLQTGIVALLGQSKHADGVDHLKHLFDHSPDRRQDVAMVFSSFSGDDVELSKAIWPYLVRALSASEGEPAEMVMQSLHRIRLRPVKAEPFRQAILAGLREESAHAVDAALLLEHWAGERQGDDKTPAAEKISLWQKWYKKRFPDAAAAELPTDHPDSKWSFAELQTFLGDDKGKAGDPTEGQRLFFGKAQCGKCHRYGGSGESLGPDLTSVASRFQRNEILESILFPSQTVSDQYKSKTLTLSDGRSISGIVGAGTGGDSKITILTAEGRRVEVAKGDVETTVVSPKSAMPERLLDGLAKEEVAHLFAFLMQSSSDLPIVVGAPKKSATK